MTPVPLLEFLLTADVPDESASIGEWWTANRAVASNFSDQVDAAAATGFAAGSVAYAFGSGYQAALRSLVPGLDSSIAAMCVTEAGGGHPRAIETVLTSDRVTGTKTFVTMGSSARTLLVLAKQGTGGDGRPQLRLAQISAAEPGVSIIDRPALPIVPELPHGEVRLDDALVAGVLEGDGYARHVKPFRTVEDIHVSAALLGWVFRVARISGWSREARERILALIAMLRSLGQSDPASPATHVALSGAMALMAEALSDVDELWQSAPAAVRDMWQRDRAILGIAQRVRAARSEAAWRVFPD